MAVTEPGYRVLLVCLGNICRSPTAEAALRRELDEAGLTDRVEVDSAGTGPWHVGEPPDRRMTEAGRAVGLELRGEARQVGIEDFALFDLILAMDERNRADLAELAPDVASGRRVRLFREFDPEVDASEAASGALDVPDPYYGGRDGFSRVVALAQAAARGVVDHIRGELASADDPAPAR